MWAFYASGLLGKTASPHSGLGPVGGRGPPGLTVSPFPFEKRCLRLKVGKEFGNPILALA